MLPMTLRKRAAAIGDTPPRPFGREICNQMPNPSISAPPPRSYRLRRHFPRHCDVTTRVLHPYKPRFLRKEGTQAARRPHHRPGISPPGTGTAPVRPFPTGIRPQHPDSFPGFSAAQVGAPAPPAPGRSPCGHGLASRQKNGFSDTGIPGIRKYYQLAFFTPGIRPFEAISRNWIRLMPNRRM